MLGIHTTAAATDAAATAATAAATATAPAAAAIPAPEAECQLRSHHRHGWLRRRNLLVRTVLRPGPGAYTHPLFSST